MSTALQEAPEAARATDTIDPRSLRGTRGWSVAARLGWRDALRHRGRTTLAMVMIGVPVLLAAGLATVLSTAELDERERTAATIGAATLSLQSNYPLGDQARAAAAEFVSEVLGPAEAVEVVTGERRLSSGDGPGLRSGLTVTDLSSPLTSGLFDLHDGRLPAETDEIMVSPGLADRLDVGIGDVVEVSGSPRTVVALASPRTQSRQTPAVIGVPGSPALLPADEDRYPLVLVSPDRPVTVDAVQRLQDAGYYVSTREDFDTAEQGAGVVAAAARNPDNVVVVVTGLTLVILQLTLLAGPAFAVGVRQQRRTLGQLVASGADARALRRVVLAQAAVVGVLGAGAGALLGVALALVLTTVARERSPWFIGPPDIPWPLLAAAVGIGVLSAVLAALAPAVTAARQSVTGVLGTSRGHTGYPWRRALTGIVLFAVSAAWLVVSTRPGSGVLAAVALGLVTLTVGLLLVVPLLVAALLPAGRLFPPVWRLAMRDSARAAGRSVAAVAAVAAATGGLVAVTTYYSSLWQFERDNYVPMALPGVARVYPDDVTDLAAVTAAAQDALPGVVAAPVQRAVQVAPDDQFAQGPSYLLADTDCVADDRCRSGGPLAESGNYLHDIAVVPPGTAVLAEGAADEPLDVTDFVADGGLVIGREALSEDVGGGARLIARPNSAERSGAQAPSVGVDVLVVDGLYTSVGGQAVISATTAERLLGAEPGWLVVGDGALSTDDVTALRAGVEDGGLGYVDGEVGYQRQISAVYVALVAAALAAMIGGTLTATALTLADSRRERAVVAAVGARPLTARLSAAATAVVIAVLGACAGVVLGLVPGVIGARSQTDWAYSQTSREASRVVDPTIVIPWLVIVGVVVVLPLLLGLAVSLMARGPAAIEGARGSRR